MIRHSLLHMVVIATIFSVVFPAGIFAGKGAGPPSHGHRPPPVTGAPTAGPDHGEGKGTHTVHVQTGAISGTLQSMSGITVPLTLTLHTGATLITVTVSAQTRVIQPATLDDFAVGDTIKATGTWTNEDTTFAATALADTTVREAYVRIMGSVAALQPSGFTLSVPKGRTRKLGITATAALSVTVSADTQVLSGTQTISTTAIQVGSHVLVMGIYRRATHQLQAARVRILGRSTPDALKPDR
jgi:hypothetical protein